MDGRKIRFGDTILKNWDEDFLLATEVKVSIVYALTVFAPFSGRGRGRLKKKTK